MSLGPRPGCKTGSIFLEPELIATCGTSGGGSALTGIGRDLNLEVYSIDSRLLTGGRGDDDHIWRAESMKQGRRSI